MELLAIKRLYFDVFEDSNYLLQMARSYYCHPLFKPGTEADVVAPWYGNEEQQKVSPSPPLQDCYDYVV